MTRWLTLSKGNSIRNQLREITSFLNIQVMTVASLRGVGDNKLSFSLIRFYPHTLEGSNFVLHLESYSH
jgi:hypothetical protein